MTAVPGRSALGPPFTVFPAIDLRNGRVVRLAQGDPTRETVYGDDPAAMARRWQSEGADWLHVVNLDGAFGAAFGATLSTGAAANEAALQAILAVGVKVQFGGGLREQAHVRRALEAGVARVVLGTAAVEKPELVDWALGEFGAGRVAVGIDARAGRVRVRGWSDEAAISALELGSRLRDHGLDWCIFTDVALDGMGGGVNVAASAELARRTGLSVIASGGAAGLEDVRRVQAAGLAGIIVGRALYEGQVRLREALNDRDR
jgi:phosphoribosylformimino-5-aminoimidazole carboxamide ribotide isomerase